MRTASIYRRGDRFIIHPWSMAVSGVFLGTAPFLVLDVSAVPTEIGAALRRALASVKTGLPHPTDFSNMGRPLLEAAGVKRWSQFLQGAVGVVVSDDDLSITFAPQANLV